MASAKVKIAAKTLIRGNNDSILMIRNPDVGWEIPGGKLEEGEDIMEGLHREVLEETGTQISDCALTGVYANLSQNGLIFAFVSRYVSGSLIESPESLQVEWVEPDQCIERVSNPVIRDRISDMISFNGKLLYRTYATGPYRILREYYM